MFSSKFQIALLFLLFFQFTYSQNDCVNAIVVCGNTNYSGLSVSGFGTQELFGSNNCGSYENNSLWFKVSIQTGGTLGFTLTPQSFNINEDYDFFVFGPNVSCSNIGQSIRCSTTNPEGAGSSSNITGMNATELDTSEGPGNLGNNFVKWLDVLDNETYFIVVDRPIGNSNFSLTWTGSATFNQPPVFENMTTGTTLNLEQCDNDAVQDSQTLFDLTQNSALAIGSQTNIVASFYTNSNDVITGLNPILNPNAYENSTNPQQIYIRLTNPLTGCFTTSQFSLSITPYTTPTPLNLEECDLDNDGYVTFSLNQNDAILSNGDPNVMITYHPTNSDVVLLPNNYTNQNQFTNETVWSKIKDITSGCYIYKPFDLIIKTIPNVTPSQLTQCDFEIFPDGLTTFNLTEAIASLTNNDTNLSTAFYLNPTAAQNNQGALNTTFNNTTNPQILSVKVTDNTTDCYSITTLTLNVNINPTLTFNLERCDDDGTEDGFLEFNLTDAGFETSGNTVTYYESQNPNDVLLEQNPISINFINTQVYQQTLYARIENANDCIGINVINLKVLSLPNIETADSAIFCLNKPSSPVKLTAGLLPGNNTNTLQYLWTPNGETTPFIYAFAAGIYTVKVTNDLGCSKDRIITVTSSDVATIKSVDIVDLTNNNTVTININEDLNQFVYSIDSPYGPFQSSNYFDNVESGIHTVYISDIEGCGVTSKEISILGIPKFFTPNADGYNDTWQIIGLNQKFFSKSNIQIFDRYGTLIKQLSATNSGWDGTFNGKSLPSSDYWYVLKLEDGRTVKGHFSLKR
jgi:gliding motility-associated-like protein